MYIYHIYAFTIYRHIYHANIYIYIYCLYINYCLYLYKLFFFQETNISICLLFAMSHFAKCETMRGVSPPLPAAAQEGTAAGAQLDINRVSVGYQ